MSLSDISIVAYDGHRAGVKPKAVLIENHRMDVLDIERAWVETGEDPLSPIIHGFEVRCEGEHRFLILHHSDAGWSAKRL